MPSPSPLTALIDRARQREFLHLAVDKAVLAAVIVMGAFVALLLAGTDILDWYWLVAAALVGLGVGAYLIRKNLSSRYRLAQRIDRELQLADAISTALYFSENPEPQKSAICERQFSQAETVASGVDVRSALPFVRSRFVVPALLLAAIAFGLFAVRYLVTGTLDLRASLVAVVFDNFFSTKTTQAKNQLPKRARFDPLMGDAQTPNQELTDQQPQEMLDSQDANDGNTPGADTSRTSSDKGSQKEGDKTNADQGNQDKPGDANSQDPGNQKADSKSGADQKPGGKQGNKQGSGNQKNEGLLDKMRDALSNLMDKMKQNDEGSKGDQAQQKGNPGEKHDDAQKGDSKDQKSQSNANQDNGQQAQGKQSSDSANDKKASNQSTSQDSKNGVGSQDGEKALKQAQELQAMGKISEILGKRSAEVTGEVMVEVGSGKQQLKTPLQQTEATHTNAGGEIHRDEIPLSEEQFIERYFEEVHKPAAAPPAASEPPAINAPKKSGNG